MYTIHKNGNVYRNATTRQQAIMILETIRMTYPRQAMAWGNGDTMHVAINGDIYEMGKI